MTGRATATLAALLLWASASVPMPAQLALAGHGAPIAPHGFPAFYSDGNLSLEPALPADQFGQEPPGNPVPAGHSTRPGLLVFSPINPANPASVALGVGDESFYWMADSVLPMPGGGQARLVMGLEAAFGGAGQAANGQQITFARIRIRIDTPVFGTYTVTYPYGERTFTNVPAGIRGINFTSDIGSINMLDPALGFDGALAGEIGPFLTWTDYLADPSLKVLDLNGNVLEQYIGDPAVPHTVTPGPNGNIFRVRGPNGLDVQTDLFLVMGKVYDPAAPQAPHAFPVAPLPNLFAVGPVNRPTTLDTTPVVPVPERPAGLVTLQDFANYPVGYPIWFQDVLDPAQPVRAGGLQLTYCPPFDAMCISAPINPADPNSTSLRVGDESFFWTAESFIDAGTADIASLPPGLEGILVLALEGAFGGAGTPLERNQISFVRTRIRIDTPVAGTYTITHPYGQEVFTNVPAGRRAINTTVDVMVADPVNPDQSFIGTLYGGIGPKFLTWDTFVPDDNDPLTAPVNDLLLQRQSLPGVPASPMVNYIGDPGIMHGVMGSPTGNNFFRIQGPNGIDVQTALFAVTGKVYDPATFNGAVNPLAPVAVTDPAALDLAVSPSVVVDVIANDTLAGAPVNPASVTIELVVAPTAGSAVIDAQAGTLIYTPNAALAFSGGVDTLTYRLTVNGSVPPLVSNNAIVTITVLPTETITIGQARFDARRLRLDLTGVSNLPGTTLTVFPDAATGGPALGTATVDINGRWRFRGTATRNLASVTLVNTATGKFLNQPLQLR